MAQEVNFFYTKIESSYSSAKFSILERSSITRRYFLTILARDTWMIPILFTGIEMKYKSLHWKSNPITFKIIIFSLIKYCLVKRSVKRCSFSSINLLRRVTWRKWSLKYKWPVVKKYYRESVHVLYLIIVLFAIIGKHILYKSALVTACVVLDKEKRNLEHFWNFKPLWCKKICNFYQ